MPAATRARHLESLGDAYVSLSNLPPPLFAMAPLAVKVKHAGKVHDVELDPELPPAVFKEAIYQKTGVPPDRMKVMIKGGMLKVRFVAIASSKRYSQLCRTTRIGERSAPKRYACMRGLRSTVLPIRP